ncbi:MAG: Holliday junction resolvase RuvX [Coriobacteriales bacterium]|jgi:putative Holliday junction resolvase|nr:Holliday junction resolvase RuvX [Coriobacteriales bacterium]
MSVMALDLGEKRTGVAVSDPALRIAHPLRVVPTHEILSKAPSFRRLLADYSVERLIVGLPLSLDGSEHTQARRIQSQARQLEQLYGLPVELADERLSSVEARSVLRQMGYNERDMRGRTDKIAAGILLQTWLDGMSSLQRETV